MKNTSLIHALLAGVIALGVIGGYVLWYLSVQGLYADIEKTRAQSALKETERARAVIARTAEEEIHAHELFVASHIVDTANIVSFLEEIESAGKAFGATVRVGSVNGGSKGANGNISLSLSISGSFDGVMRTLGVIEHGAYATSITDVSLDTTDNGKTWNATGMFVVAATSKNTNP